MCFRLAPRLMTLDDLKEYSILETFWPYLSNESFNRIQFGFLGGFLRSAVRMMLFLVGSNSRLRPTPIKISFVEAVASFPGVS